MLRGGSVRFQPQAGELLRRGVVFLHEPHHFSHQAALLLKDTRALFVPDRGDTLGDHYMDPKGRVPGGRP